MTPIEILTNVGRLIGILGVAMFLLATVLAQYTYWTKNKRSDYPRMSKKFKMMYRFGCYEFFFFIGAGALFIIIAFAKVLWKVAAVGW